MTDDQHDIVAILVKYALHEPLTGEEECALEQWRQRSAEHALLPEQFRDLRWLAEQRRQLYAPPTEEMWAEILQYIEESGEGTPVVVLPTRRRIGLAWYPVAALLLIAMVVCGMRWNRSRQTDAPAARVMPSGYKALLTLDNGQTILLDTLPTGAIINEGAIRIKKADSNSCVYMVDPMLEKRVRHQIQIGAGVYRIQWPDGSTAWLKDGSRLEFAVDLRSTENKIVGTAWFRVMHNASRPVTVVLDDGASVQVLGTSFEVRSQAEDKRVALFSGKVRVVKWGDGLELRPGWQVKKGEGAIETTPVDSNEEVGWMRPAVKTRDFIFEDVDLLKLMPEIAEWYRVTIVNPQRLPGIAITGDFIRNMPLPVLIDNIKKVEGPYVRISLRADSIFIMPVKPGL